MKKLMLVLLACLFLTGCGYENVVIIKEYSLEQIKLKDTTSISGSFFLGCGGINGETSQSFYFYTSENGAIKLRRVNIEKVTIYYTKDKPKAVFTFNREMGELEEWVKNQTIETLMRNFPQYNWDIYIPEGSIVNNYDVNIK